MEFNPLSPEIRLNPFPAYDTMRRERPVAFIDAMQSWALSRYKDVDWAIRNPQVFSSAGWLELALQGLKPVTEVPWLIETDPPAHSRVRKLVSKGFTVRMVSQLEGRVRALANELLGKMRQAGEGDFVRDFSGVFPVIVIAELMGIEPDRRSDFRRWSDNIVLATGLPQDEGVRASIRKTNAEMREYFEQAIADRRKHPREDLLTALVKAEEESQTLNTFEIIGMAILLLLAGNETTMNLLGNTMMILQQRPDDLAKVRADYSLIPKLIEEVLRYDSPVQLIYRITAQPVELAGQPIPAGAPTMLMLGSANRDPDQFPDPDRFDLMRDASEHLAFGFGNHYCLGAQLARLEAKVALEELFAQCRSFTIDSSRSERVSSIIVRGVKSLPMRLAS